MRKGTCKYSSRRGLEHICALGLDPVAMAKEAAPDGEDYKDGLIFRLPCNTRIFPRSNPVQILALNGKAACEKFTEPSDDEIADYNAAVEKRIKQFDLVIPLIKRIKKEHKESWQGVEKCPVCGSNLYLRLNHFEGIHGHESHCHGKCETVGCVSWME